MTLSIDTQHNSIDSQCPECHYAECRKFYCYAECRYAECRYVECHNAECRYAECRGALYSDSGAHPQIIIPSWNVLSSETLQLIFPDNNLSQINLTFGPVS